MNKIKILMLKIKIKMKIKKLKKVKKINNHKRDQIKKMIITNQVKNKYN